MTFRHPGGWALVAILIGMAETAPRAGEEALSSSAASALDIRLTVSSELSGVTRQALIREADAIWREARLHLRWVAADEGRPEQSLRVFVARRDASIDGDDHRWPVGELQRLDNSDAIAVASIDGAQRIVNESQAFQLIDPPAMREYRLGVVLGRAVAHEIGHYVLRTNTHDGLMRASIESREFADLRQGMFRLDREAMAHLAARAAGSGLSDGEFSYPRR